MDKCLAARARDSTMKLIYGQIFQFLIDTMNGQKSSQSSILRSINLLDIPGFGEYHTIQYYYKFSTLFTIHYVYSECFETGKNSFEQICINFVNEKMRQFCTKTLITDEINWYSMEGLETPQIGFLDNKSVLGNFSFQSIYILLI